MGAATRAGDRVQGKTVAPPAIVRPLPRGEGGRGPEPVCGLGGAAGEGASLPAIPQPPRGLIATPPLSLSAPRPAGLRWSGESHEWRSRHDARTHPRTPRPVLRRPSGLDRRPAAAAGGARLTATARGRRCPGGPRAALSQRRRRAADRDLLVSLCRHDAASGGYAFTIGDRRIVGEISIAVRPRASASSRRSSRAHRRPGRAGALEPVHAGDRQHPARGARWWPS
jgi:hypothetical protein